MPSAKRIEQDSLGKLSIPTDAYYGVHTQRSLGNFQISSQSWHPFLISAIVQLKLACAQANKELKLLPAKKANAITRACKAILRGEYSDQFPLDIFQAGSGTSTNMNVNEVIANIACEFLKGKKGDRHLVHPNDDVNKGQSTNNVIPSAIRIASVVYISDLIDVLEGLWASLEQKAEEYKDVVKSGRTHLQDAVPVTLGQTFKAYSTAVGKHIERLDTVCSFLIVLGIGGNAVGTGLNTSPKFRSLIVKHLNEEMGSEFSVSPDGIESTQFLTDIADLSSVLKLIAVDVNKICNDLRLLSSGPNTGLAEIELPTVEPGSSIMPGKVNPSICEAVNMVCMQVFGNDVTIAMACTAGNLELNTHMPIIGHNIVESLEILTGGIETLDELCVQGIEANEDMCQWYVDHSMALATALNPHIGYDNAASLVKESLATGATLAELAVKHNYMSEKELKKLLNPRKLTRPNL